MSKARLTVSGDTPEPREFELDGDIVIGRSVRADIQIEGDLVSRQHARITYREGAWHFEDLGSRNGSLVNGERTNNAILNTGDIVMIGYGKIRFEELAAASAASVFAVSIVDSEADLDSAMVADDGEESTAATVALSYRDLILVNQRISTVSRISQKLATILDRDELLGELLDTLFQLFTQLDRTAIVLRDSDGVFNVAATRQRGMATATMSVMKISTSLIQFVQREGKAVLSADTASDSRFSGRESMVAAGGRSIMCAPLQVKDEFFGVIYLDTETLAQPFTAPDLNLAQGIAGPIAIFLKNADLVSRIETETTMRASLSRYLSPDVVREISDGALTPNLGGDQAEGTIMFSDIVGFTAMSEQLAPAEVVERLNRYFTSMLEAVFGWEGTVDKFGGDAILAVWGAPVPNEEHGAMATAAALEMQVRLFDLNRALEEADETRIQMAVGLNSGKFVAGNIGGQDRIEWTVIGDTVNLAQRVESQGFPRCVLVSKSTYDSFADNAGGFAFEPVTVKNREEPVQIYSIRSLRGHRGITCAVPIDVTWGNESARGVLAKVHAKGKRRLTIRVAGSPSNGTAIQVATRLPEHPEPMTASGKVASSTPLLLSKTGRSVDIVLEESDEAFERILKASGVTDAAVQLEAIER